MERGMCCMVIKCMGAILLIVGTTAFGVYQGCLYKSRLAHMDEIKRAFLYIQGEIRYMNTPMPETLEGTAHQMKGECRAFFSRVAEGLLCGKGREFKKVWEEAADEELPEEVLEREAREILREMGGQLGCLDRQTQERAIDYFLEKWGSLIEKKQREKKDKLKLYYVCGVMSGLLMVIIIV